MSDVDVMDGKGMTMSTSDAASTLKKPVGKNVPPYAAAVLKHNNSLVDRWKTEVLDKVAINGQVDAGIVWASWNHFFEGLSIKEFIRLREEGHLSIPTQEQAEYWAQTFAKLSIDELVKLGLGSVAIGWRVCETYMKAWYAQEKWRLIYGESDSPIEWERKRSANRALINGEVFDLWDRDTKADVMDKVNTITNLRVAPQGLPGMK